MSRPQPSPRQSFVQTLLFAAVIFLGLQLFMNAQRPPDEGSAREILARMEQASAELKDQTIARLLPQFERKLDAEQMPEEQREERRLYAKSLVALTQYRAGIQRNDFTRLDAAYYTLVHEYLNQHRSAHWETEFRFPTPATVATREQFPVDRMSPKDLYGDITGALRSRAEGTYQYAIMDFLVGLTGKQPAISYTFAALLLAVLVRAIVWPLAQKQLMHSRQMMQLQPLVKEVQEKYKNDPREFQTRVMGLYREYGINPMAGCVPLLLQLPLFLFVYNWMVTYRFEFQNGVFLWINEGTSRATNGFVAPNLGHQDKILLIVYALLMVLNSFLMPVSDPSNARQQRIMGVVISAVFAVMLFFYPLPSAFVLYWAFTLIISTIQALRAYRLPLPPLQKVASASGGIIPTTAVPKVPSPSGDASTKNGASTRKAGALTHKKRKKR